MIQRVERFAYFLLIFSLISQFGKHFWPKFAFVHGVRVDYLSPTIYIHDILIFILFIFALLSKRRVLFRFLNDKLFLGGLVLLLLSSFFSKSPEAAFFGVLKFLEFSFLAFYTAHFFKKDQLKSFLRILLASSLFVSAIAIMQFIFQHSLGGIVYFFGERTFNSSTIGIAVFHHNGVSILRPYATFSHPNVLSFYLLFSLVFLLLNKNKIKINSKIYLFSLLTLVLAFLSTFSRATILFAVFIIFFFLLKRLEKRKKMLLGGVIMFTCIFLFSFGRLSFASFIKDFSYRVDLWLISWNIFIKNSLLGVGPLNFFTHEISYQKSITPTLLQPVHSVFMYVLVSTGILGFILYISFLRKTFLRILDQIKKSSGEYKKFYISIFLLFIAFIFISLFDHFFVTIQQGELLFALILGFSYSKINEAQE